VHDIASKTNYMAMSRDQHTGRSHTIEIKNNSKGWNSSIIWENFNKSKFYSGRN